MSTDALIAVHVLTGFLGSGKTSLLNRALNSGLGSGTAVIVNEFGSVGLDGIFIQERSEETIVLKSGCICCTIRTDLATALMQLAGRARDGFGPISRVVIETSGISDPAPILATLRSDFNLLTRFRIGSVICAVDPTAPDEIMARPEAIAQLAAADVAMITKQDITPPDLVENTRNLCANLNPVACIMDGQGSALASWLARHERSGPQADRKLVDLAQERPAALAHPVRSIVIRTDAVQNWPKFAVWLSSLVFVHADRILRVKGILHDPDRATWIGINGVRRVLHPPEHLALRSAPPTGACLVFITDGLDPAAIEASYRRLVIEPDLLPSDRPREPQTALSASADAISRLEGACL